ncbi:hypothetical protein GCK32_000239 [Trichostrongylus colubriformis]|uniref:Uncharacterized protein n=1 Tax=Trichostrongylus colubriformis TaxID=6319 RepID=A0AAN8EUQ9_TRICO
MISQVDQLKKVVASQAERIRQLEQVIENMDRDLCASREAHDLLEFQILETEENNRCLPAPQRDDKCIGTEKTTTERQSKCSGTDMIDTTDSTTIGQEEALSLQLREYNLHLEHQFEAQSQIIEAMKKKIAEQKVFADLVHKLAKMNETGMIREHLESYIRTAESETKLLAENFSRIIQARLNTTDSLGKWITMDESGAFSESEICERKGRRKSVGDFQHDDGLCNQNDAVWR